jgi:hypothetical protein
MRIRAPRVVLTDARDGEKYADERLRLGQARRMKRSAALRAAHTEFQ